MNAQITCTIIGNNSTGDNQAYWAICHFCSNEFQMFESPDTAGQKRVKYTMEYVCDWLFADDTWICPECQLMEREITHD